MLRFVASFMNLLGKFQHGGYYVTKIIMDMNLWLRISRPRCARAARVAGLGLWISSVSRVR